MKKFYFLVLTVMFAMTSFLAKAQIFNSILSNPGPTPFTLDDGKFWIGGTAPGNPCNGCTINIFADVKMVQNGQSSVAAYNCCGFTFLNDVVLNGGSVNVYGNTTVSINTYLHLNGVTLTLGNNPTDVQTFFVNDQIALDLASSIRIGNNKSYMDANNTAGNTVIGPIVNYTTGTNDAGLYSINTIDGQPYSIILAAFANGPFSHSFSYYGFAPPFIPFNCAGGAGFCTNGIVNGPATTGVLAPYGVVFGVSGILPVQLVQFLANKNQNGYVTLSWSTSQEVNASYYDVERSGDQTGWLKIGSVKAKGNSSITTDYIYSDKLPLDGVGYYRLKMVDLDGKFVYSKTLAVTAEKNTTPLVIYNNPFSDLIRVKVNVSRAQTLTLTVSDLMGKNYIKQSYKAQAGDNLVNIRPAVIGGSGMYVLHINGDTYNQTVKLEKQ